MTWWGAGVWGGSEPGRKAADVDVGAALLREMIARPSAAYQSVQAAKLGMAKPGGEFRAALEEAVLGDCSLVRPKPGLSRERAAWIGLNDLVMSRPKEVVREKRAKADRAL
jgi:hypothetical protein